MTSKRIKRVLVTAIGGTTGYGIVKCLSEIDDVFLIGVDADKDCYSALLVNTFITVPYSNDLNFIPIIKEIIKKHQVDYIIPTLQNELSIFNELRDEMKVILPECDNYKILLNKKLIYDYLHNQGMEQYIPKSVMLNKLEDLEYNLIKLGYPKKLVCVKPTSSCGGLGFHLIANHNEMSKNFITQRSVGMISGEELKKILEISFVPLILSEYLPKTEFSVDILVNKGKIISCVSRRRDKLTNGLVGVILKGVVIKNDEVIWATKRIARILNINGFVNFQFKYDKEGFPKLIDINPRFCGSMIMSYAAGVNFPYLALQLAEGQNVKPVEPKWNTAIKRYWESHFYEIES